MRTARSCLYVPGDRPDRFAKALATGADVVILDLEDAVGPTAKTEARQAVAAFLDAPPGDDQERWVRINAGDHGLDDVTALLGRPALAGIVVPKASAEALASVAAAAPGVPLCALVETATALRSLDAVAVASAVVAVALGEVDLAADLRLGADPLPEILWALRAQLVVAAAAAGLDTLVGPVFNDLRDLEGLERSTRDLQRAGFSARQVVHPAQVTVVNRTLTPTPEEHEQALALLALAEAAQGGATVDDAGRMVDEAVLRSARQSVWRAERR